MACGTLVLTDRLPESTHINDLFTEGFNIVYYDGLEDCISKINYYLSEDGRYDRNRIAGNGYCDVTKFHTQVQRVDLILSEYHKYLTKS
jgi:spore maturation protein CgeB